MRRFFCMCYNTAMLEIKDVTKIYPNGVKALDHLNLSIPKGKRTVLLGPSGCGKTTLLRIIAGLEDCTQGTIDRDGLSKISFVFQDDKLLERISVYDNIAYGIDLRTTSKEELKEMVIKNARRVGVESILSQKVSTLSGGQKQRVSLARALMKDPDLLLIDEGLNSLDQRTKADLIQILLSLQEQRGFTLMYVTHDLEEAQQVGNHFIELKKEEE